MVPGPTNNGVANGTAAKLCRPLFPSGSTRMPRTNLMPTIMSIMPPAILKSAIEMEKKFKICAPNRRNANKMIMTNTIVLSAHFSVARFDEFFRKLR